VDGSVDFEGVRAVEADSPFLEATSKLVHDQAEVEVEGRAEVEVEVEGRAVSAGSACWQ